MRTEKYFPVFEKDYRPGKLGLIAGFAYLLICLINLIIDWSRGVSHPNFYWLIGVSLVFVFILFNCLFYIRVKFNAQYWKRSLLTFSGLFIFTIVGSRIFSGITIDEAESFRWIYVVVTISYFVFFGITSVVKYLIGIAEKEEWNGPKSKKK